MGTAEACAAHVDSSEQMPALGAQDTDLCEQALLTSSKLEVQFDVKPPALVVQDAVMCDHDTHPEKTPRPVSKRQPKSKFMQKRKPKSKVSTECNQSAGPDFESMF